MATKVSGLYAPDGSTYVVQTDGAGNVTGGGSSGSTGPSTDASINQPSTGTLGTLLGTIATSSREGGGFFQNQSINEVFLVFDDGAGGNITIVSLDPASLSGNQGGSYTLDWKHVTRILIYGTSGAQVAARTW